MDDLDLLRRIVLDLATETKAPVEIDSGFCTICGGQCTDSCINGGTAGHSLDCPYRRAVEFKARWMESMADKYATINESPCIEWVPQDQFEITGRGTVFSGQAPTEWVGITERFIVNLGTPIKGGENIGVLVKGPKWGGD